MLWKSSRTPVGFAIHRTTLFVCLVILTLVQVVAAQDSPKAESEVTLEPVVISAARLADEFQDVRRVPGQVYVVTGQEIARTQARTVQDALRQVVPGIVSFDQIGNSYQQTVDLRGFNGQPTSVSVFVDGVRVNDPDTNAVNLDLISVQDIERIEVLPGATAVYGKDALAGVINIITKRGGRSPQTTVESGYGSYNHYRLWANTSGPIKAFDYYAGFQWERESGSRTYSDALITNFTGRLGYRPTEKTDLSLQYNYANNRLEQPGLIPLSTIGQDREQSPRASLYSNELSAVTFQGRQQLGWGVSLAANGFYRQTSREGLDFSNNFSGVTDTKIAGGTLQATSETRFWGRTNRFVLGGEYQSSWVDVASQSAFFSSDLNIDTIDTAFFVQDTFDVTSEIAVTGAVRYDSSSITFRDNLVSANDGDKRFSQWTPRAGITYTPLQVVTLYFNYGQGFRVPTTDDLFAFQGFGSNPNLKPVKSETYEGGVRTRPLEWLEVRGALFFTNVRDEILAIPDPTPACAFCATLTNVAKTQRQGVELEARARLHDSLDVMATYAYTDARYTENASTDPGLPQKGDRVALVPFHRATAMITYRPVQGLAVSLDGLYVGQQVLLNNETNQTTFRVQDYYALNARVSYTWQYLTAFLRLNNLTNNKYETYGAWSSFFGQPFLMPAPGFNVFGGVTVRFENYY